MNETNDEPASTRIKRLWISIEEELYNEIDAWANTQVIKPGKSAIVRLALQRFLDAEKAK